MGLVREMYSMLLISQDENFEEKIAQSLPPNLFYPLKFAKELDEACLAMSNSKFDIILVKGFQMHDVTDVTSFCNESSAVMALVLGSKAYNEALSTACGEGIVLIDEQIGMEEFLKQLQIMCAMRARIKKFEKRASVAEEKIDGMKIINRAKWLLVGQLKMTEPQAHHFIEKQAMNRCESKIKVAQTILATYK